MDNSCVFLVWLHSWLNRIITLCMVSACWLLHVPDFFHFWVFHPWLRPTLDFFFPRLIPTMPFPHSDLFLSDFMHFKPLNYFQTNWGFKYKVWEASWSNLSLQSLFSLCKWQGCITVISSVMFSMVRQVWLSHLIAHFTIYCSLNDTHLVAPIYPPTYTSVCHSSTNIIHRTSASLFVFYKDDVLWVYVSKITFVI